MKPHWILWQQTKPLAYLYPEVSCSKGLHGEPACDVLQGTKSLQEDIEEKGSVLQEDQIIWTEEQGNM